MSEDKAILACITGLPPSDSITDYASWFARVSGKKLKLFHAIEHKVSDSASDLSGSIGLGAREELLEELVALEHEQNKLLRKRAQLLLEAAKERSQAQAVTDLELCLKYDEFVSSLKDLAAHLDLVVIGKYGTSHQSGAGVGHRVQATVRSLELPILVVSEKFKEPQKILFAYDGSESSQKALEYVVSSKAFLGKEFHLVHIGEESILEEAAIKLARVGIHSRSVGLNGSESAETLMKYAQQQELDFVIMGAFGHHWMRNLLMGSFTAQMLSHCDQPLLLVR